MKKQNLHILLSISAVITSLATYAIVKLEVFPVLLSFLPFMLFAIALLAFSKHLKKYHDRWSSLFVALLMKWLLAMGILFVLFRFFPADGMLPSAWTVTDVIMLLSVNAAFALVVSFALSSIIHAITNNLGISKNNQAEKVKFNA